MTVACYLHDVTAGRELAHQGFAVDRTDWRRAAHKCADMVYSRLSGQQPFLDTRIVYVAETGPKNNRQKRIAHHGFRRQQPPLSDRRPQHRQSRPRFSPRGDKLVYVSYIGRRPRVLLYDVATGRNGS